MKFFGDSKTTRFLEKYHPAGSALALAAIYSLKYTGHTDLFNRFTDISYGSTMKRDHGEVEHFQKGWDDAFFVFFFFHVVTVVRFLYTHFFLKPVAKRFKFGRGLTLKFVDSSWFSLFYLASTTYGYFIFRDDDWWYSSVDLWKGYPHPFDKLTKHYYLASLAFWIQCLFSFFFEASRKDDGAFFFHHLLTIGLITSSYHFNFFRVGAAILMEQNAADIFYYTAKSVKYMKYEKTATSILVVFIFVWIYTRHFIFGWILYSLWFELPAYINKPGWDPVSGYYYADWLYVVFSIALCALQGLMIYWFGLILRVAYRAVVWAGVGDDPTDGSDDESSEEEKNGAEIDEKTNGKSIKNGKNGTNGTNGTNGKNGKTSPKVNGTNGHHVQKEKKKEK